MWGGVKKDMKYGRGPGESVFHGPRTSSLRHCFLIILVVKCASIISNSAYILLHCKMFYTFYFSRNMLTSPWLLYLFVCWGVGGWVYVWVWGCVRVCGGVWGCVGVCKYTVPPNKDLDVGTQYKRGCTSDQGCPRFPVMPWPGAWEIANSIKMFKMGPQMNNNNDFFSLVKKYKHTKQNKRLNDNPGKKKWTKTVQTESVFLSSW